MDLGKPTRPLPLEPIPTGSVLVGLLLEVFPKATKKRPSLLLIQKVTPPGGDQAIRSTPTKKPESFLAFLVKMLLKMFVKSMVKRLKHLVGGFNPSEKY